LFYEATVNELLGSGRKFWKMRPGSSKSLISK